MRMNDGMLNRRLSEFRRKYYYDKMIRGSLILALLTTSIFLVALLGEGLFGFSSAVRTGIMFGLGLIFMGVLGSMVVWPLLKLFQVVKPISDFYIADVVKSKFPNINDKLINLLQLKRDQEGGSELVAAAIDSKSNEIAPVKLSSAVNLKVNYKYLRFLLIPLLLFLVVFIADREMVSTSLTHLVNFQKEYTPPPPFGFANIAFPEQVVAGQDYPVKVTVEGDELPAELFIFMKKGSEDQYIDYSLNKVSNTEFTYNLTNVKENFNFFIGNPDVESGVYKIDVLKRPFIKNFNIRINYPSYTGLAPEELEENVGDFKVIKGSTVTWSLRPYGDVKEVSFMADGKSEFREGKKAEEFVYSKRMMEDFQYFISLTSDEDIKNSDTVKYTVDILQDRYPSIYVFSPNNDFLVDLDPNLPLELEIADDFGFTNMALFYRFVKSGGTNSVSEDYSEYPLEIEKRTLLQPLDYTIDLTKLGLKEGDQIEYYIKVWDNDGVAGPKASTSATFKVTYPTLDEKYDEVTEKQDEVKNDLKSLKDRTEDLKSAYRKMQEKLLDKKQLSFDDKKEVQRMIDEHQDIMKEVEETQKNFEETKEELQNNQLISEETLDKYEKLNELLEELQNPEIQKMLEELSEKLENLDPEDIKEKLEDLELNDEELQESIERTMELLKQLEVQEKIDEIRNKLDKLEAKQELLNEQLEESETSEEMEELAEKQEELDNQMEGIKRDMEELGEMKSETETPDEEMMDELQEDADEAQEQMKEASEEMKEAGEKMDQKQKKAAKGAKSKASEKQKDAKKKMEEMSDKLSNMQMQMQMQQDQQNLENLRELLENLLKLSFDQEDLRDDVKKLKYGDPSLKDKSRDQKKLQDDMGLVKDSLESLASKVFQIQKFVMEESKLITKHMKQSQSFFRNKQIPTVNYHQQMAMTSINNLANMLSEVMDQIQQQMKSSMPGNQMCPKPGGNPSMQQLGKQQQNLNQMMQQMMNSGKMDSEKLAKMAAQQEAIRKQLEDAHNKIKENGGKALGDLDKIAQDMIQSETELLNKQLTHETLKRQQEILTRLLQADKSVREREYDNKRESKVGKEYDKKSPEELSEEEYKNKIRQELLKSNKLEYSNDFIILIEQYYKKLEESKE